MWVIVECDAAVVVDDAGFGSLIETKRASISTQAPAEPGFVADHRKGVLGEGLPDAKRVLVQHTAPGSMTPGSAARLIKIKYPCSKDQDAERGDSDQQRHRFGMQPSLDLPLAESADARDEPKDQHRQRAQPGRGSRRGCSDDTSCRT